jgi:hypothetical protein
MSEASSSPSRIDLDAARDAIRVKGPPPETEIGLEGRPDGTRWDKEAPTRPPGDEGIAVPPHLKEVADFFQEIINSEAFLLELCFDRTFDMVATAVGRRIIGTDMMDGEGQTGGPFTPTHYAGIAGPMTVELYKSVLKSIEGQEKEYQAILKRAGEKAAELRQEAIRARQKSPIGKGGIVLPGSF